GACSPSGRSTAATPTSPPARSPSPSRSSDPGGATSSMRSVPAPPLWGRQCPCFLSWRAHLMALAWISQMLKQLSRLGSRSGRRQSRRPVRLRVEGLEDRQVPTVSFFGGNVLSHVQAQALYLGNEFSSAPANTEPATLDAFLKDITGGPYMQAL